MTRSLLIRGGEIVDPDGRRRADVLVRDGHIAAVAESFDDAEADVVVDAEGAVVASGFVDLATHVDEPGPAAADTVSSAAWGAAAGGFTTIHVLPDTDPAVDDPSVVRDIERCAVGSPVAVRVVGALTKGRAGAELAPLRELRDVGVTRFTDGRAVRDVGLLRRLLDYASCLDIGVVLHPECADLGPNGVMNEGVVSSRLGVAGRPAVAEELGVSRDLAVARLAGTPVHFSRVTTAAALDAIAAAKAAGQPVTCDVTSHHLVATDDWCAGFDTATRVEPPLRTEADVAAVRARIADGTVDAIVTDHRAVVPEDKEMPFDHASPGSLGLETAFAAAWSALDVSIEHLLRLLSWQPAQLARLGPGRDGRVVEGNVADLVVLDLEQTWTVSGQRMISPSHNSLHEGRTLTGSVRHTIAAGLPVVLDGEVTR